MSPVEAKQRIEALSQELRHHSYNYYVLAMPAISDFEFDKKLEELAALEKQFPEFLSPDSPTQKVGGEITKEFQTGGKWLVVLFKATQTAHIPAKIFKFITQINH